MRWEDERYVRFYTRNSPEWLALSWRARGLFGLILREVDRAGILKVGKLGLKGVAVAIGAPWVDVEPLLQELLTDECVRFDADRQCVYLPNFIEAQECPQSDKARKRASREKAIATFSGTPAASEKARRVTNSDTLASQAVTDGHAESRDDTTSHAESLCAVPCRADQNKPSPPASGLFTTEISTPPVIAVPEPERESSVRVVAAAPVLDSPAGALEDGGVSAWVDGVRSVTGESLPVERYDFRKLIDRLREGAEKADCKTGQEAISFATAEGASYARARAGSQLSVKFYRDWVGSGRPTPGATLARAKAASQYDGPDRLWNTKGIAQ